MKRTVLLLLAVALVGFVAVDSLEAQLDIPAGYTAGQTGMVVGAGPDTVAFSAVNVSIKGVYVPQRKPSGIVIWAMKPFTYRRIGTTFEDLVHAPVDTAVAMANASGATADVGSIEYPCRLLLLSSEMTSIIFHPTASDTLWYMPLY